MPQVRPTAAAIAAAALAVGCGLSAVSPAAAHVTLEVQAAQAGAAFKAVFRIPHGCEGSATVGLHVVLPEGSLDARPMPKPGWTLRTVRRPLAEPVPDGHGGEMRETAAEIVWEGGRLEDAHYDEFVVRFRTPDRPGETVWIPVTQTCEGGKVAAWTEVPEPGRRVTDYRRPAVVLRLTAPRN
jgi:periplasmic copper chaperone A